MRDRHRRVVRQGASTLSRAHRPQPRYLTPEARLKAAREKFQEAASLNLDTDQIAALFHVSYGHLTRLLKQAGLPPPMHRIRTIHLQEAAHKLEDRTASLEDLAQEFGYANASSLRRAFHRILGKTVTELRKSRKAESN